MVCVVMFSGFNGPKFGCAFPVTMLGTSVLTLTRKLPALVVVVVVLAVLCLDGKCLGVLGRACWYGGAGVGR